MSLIQTISSSDLFHMAARLDRAEQFGYDGWNAIGEYLENLSDETGENMEIDIIAICCEYSRADSVDEFFDEYGDGQMDVSAEDWEGMDDDEKLAAIESYLQDNTSVVACDGDMIIWAAF